MVNCNKRWADYEESENFFAQQSENWCPIGGNARKFFQS